MLLAIDVGNTQTVVGLYRTEHPPSPREAATGAGAGKDLVEHWRVATDHERTGDEHFLLLADFLGHLGFSLVDDVSGVVVASVVPRLTSALRDMAARHLRLLPLVVEPGVRTGMPILYDNPKEVGADRIANAVGAFDLHGGPAIVVDFGTATTLDAVSARGEYVGGAIIPGVEISLDALFARADRLTRVELVPPRGVIGKNTVESVQSGVIHGTVCLVDGLCRRFQGQLGASTVVGTGGLAGLFAPLSEAIQHHEPWLTLHGLRLINQRNLPATG